MSSCAAWSFHGERRGGYWGREKREEVSKLHMGGEKEASIRVRDGGREHRGAERESWGSWSAACCCVRGSHRRQQFIADLFGLTEGFILPLSLCLPLSLSLSLTCLTLQKCECPSGITSSWVYSKARYITPCCVCVKQQKKHLSSILKEITCVSLLVIRVCVDIRSVHCKNLLHGFMILVCQQRCKIQCARRKQCSALTLFAVFLSIRCH